jgi:hypothetical protein
MKVMEMARALVRGWAKVSVLEVVSAWALEMVEWEWEWAKE